MLARIAARGAVAARRRGAVKAGARFKSTMVDHAEKVGNERGGGDAGKVQRRQGVLEMVMNGNGRFANSLRVVVTLIYVNRGMIL